MFRKPAVSIPLIALAFIATLWWSNSGIEHFRNQPIKVGLLHSLTGTMSISSLPVVDATLLAIDEINQKGGLLNSKIVPILLDGRSDWDYSASQAKKLITQDQVSVIFGCWTSSSRKKVKDVVEKYNSLLVYPVHYEGLEQSANILYVGSAPNQQIVPAIKWAFDNMGKKFFLVGSDYVFPHTAHAIIKDQIYEMKGTVVGEEYVKLGSRDVKNIVQKIKKTNPDVIINTINGDTNTIFFKTLRQEGITPKDTPVFSFSLSESEVSSIGVEYLAGNYAAGNYFQSIDSVENVKFVTAFKKRYGAHRSISDAMEAAYVGVHLWAQAVASCGSAETYEVVHCLKEQSIRAPEGILSVDPQTMHLWKTVRIGKVNNQGQFDIVWNSEYPIRPKPYPPTRSESEWDQFLQNLYQSWGNQWSN